MTEQMIDNLREENPVQGAGEVPPTDAGSQAAVGMEPGDEVDAEKVPWHNDPRFKQFLTEKKQVEEKLSAISRQEIEAREKAELEAKPAMEIPPEMPLPTDEEFEAADLTPAQASMLRKFVDAAVHKDRKSVV